jgi:hypothetical protein
VVGDQLMGAHTEHALAPGASADALARPYVEDSRWEEDTAYGMARGVQLERVGEDTRHRFEDDARHATSPGDQQDQHCAMLVVAAVDSVAELADHLVLPRV